MTEKNKNIWKKLEDNIGTCILFRESALNEIINSGPFALQFATFSDPQRIENFLKSDTGILVSKSENGKYNFTIDNVRVNLHCFKIESDFGKTYSEVFDRSLRCENLGINIMGNINKNTDAYNDIISRELHFSSMSVKMTDVLIFKILKYVLHSGFSIGDDIIEYFKINHSFDDNTIKNKYISTLTDNIRKGKSSWQRVAESLKLVKDLLLYPDLISYTSNLDNQNKSGSFVRNYLYNLYISLNMKGNELQSVMSNEPSLEYFDSLATNIAACLGEYSVYMNIKNKYGVDFLKLLMDVQENIAQSLGLEYKRVSEDSFDQGKLFIKDDRFWCSLDDIKKETDDSNVQNNGDLSLDASEGSVENWMSENFDASKYSDSGESTQDKKYIDDIEDVSDEKTGLDTSAFDSYESKINKSENIITNEMQERKETYQSIMDSHRGHESKVLMGGGA